jgi:hypothetical protein
MKPKHFPQLVRFCARVTNTVFIIILISCLTILRPLATTVIEPKDSKPICGHQADVDSHCSTHSTFRSYGLLLYICPLARRCYVVRAGEEAYMNRS